MSQTLTVAVFLVPGEPPWHFPMSVSVYDIWIQSLRIGETDGEEGPP